MTKEEILKPFIEHSSDMFDSPKDVVEDCNCYIAMQLYSDKCNAELKREVEILEAALRNCKLRLTEYLNS